ncbi:MAG: RNA polymerase sigma factor [Bacteroidota bacterium]
MNHKEELFKKTLEDNDETIRRICRYYAPSEEDRKDMYQEVLVNIWRSLDKFRRESAISTWIYRIAVNTALSYAGRQYRLMKLNVDIDTPHLKKVLPDENEFRIDELQLQQLQDHLNRLNVIDKAIMGLVLDDLSMKEIAEVIGITEQNVRVKIHRIKEHLKLQMKGGKV